jgi:hypothetical protein
LVWQNFGKLMNNVFDNLFWAVMKKWFQGLKVCAFLKHALEGTLTFRLQVCWASTIFVRFN